MSADGQPPFTDAAIILSDATPTEYGRRGNVTESERADNPDATPRGRQSRGINSLTRHTTPERVRLAY